MGCCPGEQGHQIPSVKQALSQQVVFGSYDQESKTGSMALFRKEAGRGFQVFLFKRIVNRQLFHLILQLLY